MIEIGTAISSLAALKTIFDGAVSLRDESKLMEVKLAFQQQMIEVQNALLAMQNALAQAQQKERDFADAERRSLQFDEDTKGYVPFEAAPGVFVIAVESVDGARPKLPYYCYSCHKERKQSILGIEDAKVPHNRASLNCASSGLHRLELPRHWRREHLIRGLAGSEPTQ